MLILRTVSLIALLPWLSAASPAPGSKLAVLGFGDCADPATAAATRAVRAKVLGAVLSEEETAAPGSGLPGPSLAEINRILEVGKTAFLNLDPKAEPTLRNLLGQIDRLPLGPARWELFWETRAWLARVLQHDGQKAKATELYLQILKVDEEFQLGRVDFPPSSRELLDLTRSLLPSLPRARLQVTARDGGGEVYLNGFAVGPVPFTKALIAGEYEVVVADGARRSFVRRIKLLSNAALEVDLQREAPFTPGAGPCYQTGAGREERLKAAATLAGALGADQVVAVRLEMLGSEEYVAAALVEVAQGRETREGRVRREGGRIPNPRRLAQFVLTGEGSPEPEPEDEATGSVPSQAFAAADEAGGRAPADSKTKWQRPVAYVLWGLAVAAGGAAVYEHYQATESQKKVEETLNPNGSVKPDAGQQYEEAHNALEAARAARLGLGIGAAVAAVAGVGAFVWSVVPGQSRGEPQVAVTVAGHF